MRSITQPLSGKFHRLNEIIWELEQGVSSRANLTFSPTKYALSPHTNTFKHSHTQNESCVSILPSMALCFFYSKPFNHQTDTVSCHRSYIGLWRVYVLNLAERLHISTFFCNISRGYSVADVLGLRVRQQCVVVCGSQLGSQQRCWSGRSSAQPQSGSPQGPGFTGTINNHKWHVPSVLCPRLHWAYLFCGCRLQSRPVYAHWVGWWGGVGGACIGMGLAQEQQ